MQGVAADRLLGADDGAAAFLGSAIAASRQSID
jgi:hypothetical protein